MTFLKIIFLLLLVLPFAVFLLFIVDRLMDEMPKRSASESSSRRSYTPEERAERRKPSKRKRRKARKQKKRE